MDLFYSLSYSFDKFFKSKQFKVCLIFLIIQVCYFLIFNNLETQDKRDLYYYTQAKIFHKFLPDYKIHVKYIDKNNQAKQGYYSAKAYYDYACPNGEPSSYSKYVLGTFKSKRSANPIFTGTKSYGMVYPENNHP